MNLTALYDGIMDILSGKNSDPPAARKIDEYTRSQTVERIGRRIPCLFNDGLSEDTFIEMAAAVAQSIKRIESFYTKGAKICCTVRSIRGYTDWEFTVNFNNWGHITPRFRIYTDNDDSAIPRYFARTVASLIHEYYDSKGIVVPDYVFYVRQNKDLGTGAALGYTPKKSFFTRKSNIPENSITLTYSASNLAGTHLYPVISLLRDSGFKNIETHALKDINDRSKHYLLQVQAVFIDGNSVFESGETVSENSEVIVMYHEKQTIKMPYSEDSLIGRDYMEVATMLHDLGFSKLYAQEINDLVTGWIVNVGAAGRVLLNGNLTTPITRNAVYDYDQEIVISYHEKKHRK